MGGKQAAYVLFATGGLSLGLYFLLRGRGFKQMADRLSFRIEPILKGIRQRNDFRTLVLPLDLIFTNRSAESIALRIHSAKVKDGRGREWADVAAGTGLKETRIAPHSVSRIRAELEFGSIQLMSQFGLSSLSSLMQAISRRSTSKRGLLADTWNSLIGQFKPWVRTLYVTVAIEVDGIALDRTIRLVEDTPQGIAGLGLVSTASRPIGPKSDYLHLIPGEGQLERTDPHVFTGTTTETAAFIRQVARQYHQDVARLAATLSRETLRETLSAVYGFVYRYIRYTKDSPLREEVRIPLRTLHDQMGDCDCYATLIASMLEALGIPYRVRLAAYKGRGYFQHVYIVVPAADAPRGYWTIDPVVEGFDTEEPFSNHKDI